MKIISKFKKIGLIITTFFVGISTKVFAANAMDMVGSILYGPPQADYGIVTPEKSFIVKFLPIFLIISIPLIFIIGIVVFIKHKSKKDNNEE